MAISLADKQSFNSSGGLTATGAWPNGAPSTGDLLIAAYAGQFGATVTLPANWTALVQDASNFTTGFAYRWAGASEPNSISFVLSSGSNLFVTAMRFSGGSQVAWAQGTNWSDNDQLVTTALASTPLTASATPGQQPVVFFVQEGVSPTIATGPAGYTNQSSQTSTTYMSYGYTANATTTASQTVNPSATASIAGVGDVFLALITPAATAAGGGGAGAFRRRFWRLRP